MHVAPFQTVAVPGLSQAVAVPGRFSHDDRKAILSWSKWRSRHFHAAIEARYAGFHEVAEVWCHRPSPLLYLLVATAKGVTLECHEECWSLDFATAAEALACLMEQEAGRRSEMGRGRRP